jgi:energy-coupling factor transport system ATP-binding protein
LTLNAAEEHFHLHKLSIDDARRSEVREKDRERLRGYGPEIIRVEGLTQSYDDRQVLKGIELCVREREFVAVLGANGSGKTTLVKHFNGLLRPMQGKVFLSGRNCADLSLAEIGKVVGYVFQNPDQQIFCDTVYEEVAFALKLRGFTNAETAERVREALEAVGLTGCEAEDPFSLPKGQRQRVAVASVLAFKPPVLVLDEPTTGLDFKDQKRMMDLVKTLNEAGHTIVMITHTMWVVAEYAHRVVLMRDGNIISDAGTRDSFADESMLSLAEVRAPQITRLGNRVGCTALSVDELKYCTNWDKVRP